MNGPWLIRVHYKGNRAPFHIHLCLWSNSSPSPEIFIFNLLVQQHLNGSWSNNKQINSPPVSLRWQMVGYLTSPELANAQLALLLNIATSLSSSLRGQPSLLPACRPNHFPFCLSIKAIKEHIMAQYNLAPRIAWPLSLIESFYCCYTASKKRVLVTQSTQEQRPPLAQAEDNGAADQERKVLLHSCPSRVI